MIEVAVVALLVVSAASQTADELWVRGERVAAVEAQAGELAAHPGDRVLARRLAEREIEIHRYAAALEHLAPLGPEVDPMRGVALFRLGRFAEAVEKLDPNDCTHLLMRIDALEALADFERAAKSIESAMARCASEPAVLSARARELGRLGRHSEAIPLFRRALEADPLLMEARFGLGQALLRSDQRDEAATVLARHRELVPLVDALDHARQNLDLAPNHAPNVAAMGDAERALGHVDRAEASYRHALSLSAGEDRVPIALRLARLLAEDRSDVARAVDLLDAEAGLRPDARLLVRAGDLLAASGKRDEALVRYERARELRPDDREIARRIEATRNGR